MRPVIESEQRKGGGCCAAQLSRWESQCQKNAVLFFFKNVVEV